MDQGLVAELLLRRPDEPLRLDLAQRLERVLATTPTSEDVGETPNAQASPGYTTNTEGVLVVDDPFKWQTSMVAKLPLGTAVEVLDEGAEQIFNACDERYQWWRVRGTDGAARGSEGWAMQVLLTKSAGGTPNEPMGGLLPPGGPRVPPAPPDVGWESHRLSLPEGVGEGSAVVAVDPDNRGDPNSFTMNYSGGDASRFHWLQFAWSELLGRSADGWEAIPGISIESTARADYESTPGGTLEAPGSPTSSAQTSVDGGNGTVPWKDANESQTPSQVGATDKPSFMRRAVETAFSTATAPEEIQARDWFEIFLVADEKEVVAHARVCMSWEPIARDALEKTPACAITCVELAAGRLPRPFADALRAANFAQIARRLG
jgi:hypothetical protein